MKSRLTGIASQRAAAAISSLLLAGIAACLLPSGFARAQTSAPPAPAWQTAAGGHMEFEVATIKPGDPGKFIPPTFGLNIDDAPIPPGGRFIADFTLPVYIAFAYKLILTPEQRTALLAHLPDWVRTQEFVIEAQAPVANPTKDQMRLMVQSLLADRFKLALHFETRDIPVLAIVLAKPNVLGPRLRPHAQGLACDAKWTPPADPNAPAVPPGGFLPKCGDVALDFDSDRVALLGGRNVPMEHIAQYLPAVYKFGRPIVDQTGLTGTFDFSLNWAPDSNSQFRWDGADELGGPEFLDALKNQLGLKLIPTRAPVQTLVIDHIEQPSPN